MKIRNGFVSNSSSASYIINIKGVDTKDFLELMQNEFNSYFGEFDAKKVTEDLKARMKWEWKILNEYKEGKSGHSYIFSTKEQMKKKIWDYIGLIKKLQDPLYLESEEYIGVVLEKSGIGIIETTDGISLNYFTAMHNSYDDVPNIMKQIITYYAFNTPDKMECKVDMADDY